MMDLLIWLIVLLIVAGLLYWATMTLARAFQLPAPIVAVVQVILVVLIVLLILSHVWPGHLPALR
jgi:hypothetical protein